MRRVLSVIAGPTFGGAHNQAERLYAPLRARGWELVVVVPPDAEVVMERLRSAGIEVHAQSMHRLRATRSLRPHAALARRSPGEVADLRRLVRDTGSAVVQNHGDLNPQAGIAGHLEGAAVHWHLLDTRTPPALRRVTMAFETRLADSVSTVGEALADTHPGVRGLGDRCLVVFPPVDAAVFAGARARREEARRELGVPEGALCLGAVGNRNPQKGHEWLVRAAARVRAVRPDVVVRILGMPSPGHGDYEAGLLEEAHRLGLDLTVTDPGRRVPELIGAFDVLCMSSVPNSEGLPTVVLEAMAAGVPVVTTDVGAVREAVLDGETGLVVPPLDDRALADALLADPAHRAVMAEAAGRRMRETFSLDALADQFDRAYALALEHRLARRRRAAAARFS